MWTKAGLDTALTALLSRGLTLRLFRNDMESGGAEAVECDFPGYAPQPLASWELLDGEAHHPRVAFTRSVSMGLPQSAYGFYYTDSAGVVLRSVRFEDAPHEFINAGDETSVVPVLIVGEAK